ncbi:MAG: PHP domain-containing protein [Ruminococcus sp.]|nr:PHP domain-containing protein [Ruminococcus sp.]MBQ1433793.1 PHP domain-containing protein [Ruminococcus sp.]
MFKYETHLHTAEASACASAKGAEQARRYKDEGYDGIFVTDHFFNGNSTVHHEMPWKDMVERYCSGYEHAKEEGDRIGLKVFFGIEYTYGGADILVYGLDKQWLLDNPDCDRDFFDFQRKAKAAGALLIHAHPFREADYLREIRLLPQWVDGVEVYNSGNYKDAFNDRALWYAKEFGFRMTAGTDNHHLTVDSARLCGIQSEVELLSAADYKKAFFEDKISPIYPLKKLDG